MKQVEEKPQEEVYLKLIKNEKGVLGKIKEAAKMIKMRRQEEAKKLITELYKAGEISLLTIQDMLDQNTVETSEETTQMERYYDDEDDDDFDEMEF